MNPHTNYTPLNIKAFRKPKTSSSVLISSLTAFVFGAVLIGVVFVSTQSAQRQSYKTKASEPTPVCITEITNPQSAQAFIIDNNDQAKEIFSHETISTSSVTIQWEKVAQASGYYVMLSNDPYALSGAVDPAEKGLKVLGTSHQFDNLKPGQTYYVLIRSVNEKGVVALTYPTIGNCRFLVGALPLFQLKTSTE